MENRNQEPIAPKEKKPKKKPEPSPWKVYHRKEDLKAPFLRIGYFDDWQQLWCIEGRRRNLRTGMASGKWEPVGYLSDRTEWYDDKLMSQHFVDRVPSFRDEIRRYKERVRKLVDDGGSLRDLHLEMARKNGTWKEDR